MKHHQHRTPPSFFKSRWLNKFANTNPIYAVGIFSVLSITIFAISFAIPAPSILVKIALFFAGILAFTLVEYAFHRFVFHSDSDFKSEENSQDKIHSVQNIQANVDHILAMPIPIAFFVLAVFFGLFYLVMGTFSFHFFPGFILGYAVYIFIHLLVHTRKPPKNIFAYIWKHHHLHHYQFDDKAFGVSSHLWDFVFGTMPPKDAKGRVR